MKLLQRVLLILWRIWFYILCTIPVICFFPFLAITFLLPKGYNLLFWFARNIWSLFVMLGMGFYIKKSEKFFLDPKKAYLLVANHTSYIDVMLIFRLFKTPFFFVGKEELVRIPFFGFIYRKNAILVDRSDKKSRYAVYGQASEKLKKGYSVFIFPEKEYTEESNLLNEFKHGAFKLAIAHKLPVVPIVLYDCKRKFPWHTAYGYPGALRVSIFPPIITDNLNESDFKKLLNQTRDFIEQELIKDSKKSALQAVELWKQRAS